MKIIGFTPIGGLQEFARFDDYELEQLTRNLVNASLVSDEFARGFVAGTKAESGVSGTFCIIDPEGVEEMCLREIEYRGKEINRLKEVLGTITE